MIFLACASLASLSGAADRPKTIIDLQPFRTTTSIRIKDAGGKEGLATLINLNPAINSWYLLRLNWGGGAPEEAYHLQNARPRTQTLLLEETSPNGLVIARGKERSRCDLWGADSTRRLEGCQEVSRALRASLRRRQSICATLQKGTNRLLKRLLTCCEKKCQAEKKSFPLCAIRSLRVFTRRKRKRKWSRNPRRDSRRERRIRDRRQPW